MVSVYALLCAATLLRSDCTPATAIDLIRLPDAENEMVCLQGSMVTLAGLAVQPQAGEYWKIICARADRQIDVAGSTAGPPPLAQAPPSGTEEPAGRH